MKALILVLVTVLAPLTSAAQPQRVDSQVRARHDIVLRWASRYRLDTAEDPIGLEQQLWRRVDALPIYNRVALDARDLANGRIDLHFTGWGALDFLADSTGAVAAGDVAIGYLEVDLAPARLWAGRRFMSFGPPGGLHVDGGGVSTRTSGVITEAFVGRPVTPARSQLLGPEPDFEDATIAYGARVGYGDSDVSVSAGYAELWGGGIVGSRTVDVAGYWYPGTFRFEAGSKIDVRDLGVAQARLAAGWRVSRPLSIDLDYLHLEPGRWIPSWSIFSVFETSTFDELSAGGTWRPMPSVAIRVEAAARRYSDQSRLGYRADVMTRILPSDPRGVRLRVLASRRDDGVVGYTIVQAGAAFDPRPAWVLAVDGSFAIDDRGQRDTMLGRATVEAAPSTAWKLGLTVALARTPVAAAETRVMLRATWRPGQP